MTSEPLDIAVIGGTAAEGRGITCDVLVCSDSPFANSAAAEAMTSLLIRINRAYKIPDAGLAITGNSASKFPPWASRCGTQGSRTRW